MMNPVLRRETRTTLRNWKIYCVIMVYVLGMAAVCGIFIWGNMAMSYYNGIDPTIATAAYMILAVFQLGLVLMTTPALTAGSISGERERQTLDLLLITKMSAFSIVLGKLLSSLSIIVLLTIASMPVFAVLFYFGGLSVMAVFATTAFTLVVACMVGAVSIFLSTIFRKTVVSMVIVYLFIGCLCGGTVIIFVIYVSLYYDWYTVQPPLSAMAAVLSPNPIIGFMSVLERQSGSNLTDIFFNYFYYDPLIQTPIYITNFWAVNCIVNMIITGIFLALSCIFIKRPKKK